MLIHIYNILHEHVYKYMRIYIYIYMIRVFIGDFGIKKKHTCR